MTIFKVRIEYKDGPALEIPVLAVCEKSAMLKGIADGKVIGRDEEVTGITATA